MARKYNWKRHAKRSKARAQLRASESLDADTEVPVRYRRAGGKSSSAARRNEVAALLSRLRRLEVTVVTLVDNRISHVNLRELEQLAQRIWEVHCDESEEDRSVRNADKVLLPRWPEAASEGESRGPGRATYTAEHVLQSQDAKAAGSRSSQEEDEL